MEAGNTHVTGDCRRVAPILSLIGDKWSVLVIIRLGRSPLRFSELKRSIDNISQRMLTFTLRGLERSGIVSRSVLPTNPPRVDYALTPLGRSLLEPIGLLGRWAHENADKVEAAQLVYDQRKPVEPPSLSPRSEFGQEEEKSGGTHGRSRAAL